MGPDQEAWKIIQSMNHWIQMMMIFILHGKKGCWSCSYFNYHCLAGPLFIKDTRYLVFCHILISKEEKLYLKKENKRRKKKNLPGKIGAEGYE